MPYDVQAIQSMREYIGSLTANGKIVPAKSNGTSTVIPEKGIWSTAPYVAAGQMTESEAEAINKPKAAGKGDGIKVASTPVGDITIPKPGEWATRTVVFTAALLVFVISLAALLMKNPAVNRGVKAAAGATPIGAGLKAARG